MSADVCPYCRYYLPDTRPPFCGTCGNQLVWGFLGPKTVQQAVEKEHRRQSSAALDREAFKNFPWAVAGVVSAIFTVILALAALDDKTKPASDAWHSLFVGPFFGFSVVYFFRRMILKFTGPMS